MKKIILILPLIILLCGCGESVAVNIGAFKENVNEQFGVDIMNIDDIFTQSEENEDVSHWLPEGYNVCCSMFCDKKTGIIKKYTVTSEKSNPKYESFCKTIEKAICKNNQNINISTYAADNLIIPVYEDTRYLSEDEVPTLKSEIDEKNLNQPVAEKTLKEEN